MNKISELEKGFMKKDIADFNVGDTVKVLVKIKEGDKTRLQAFEGIVIARKGSGIKETFTLRRISYGEGVERLFQLHSPLIDSILIVKKGKVRRAKLYYLRKKIGKASKIEEARTPENKEDASLGKKGVS
ncbi:MAG: 50S ribosomal protein L19 [Candidatus Omnitrophota bacterium]